MPTDAIAHRAALIAAVDEQEALGAEWAADLLAGRATQDQYDEAMADIDEAIAAMGGPYDCDDPDD